MMHRILLLTLLLTLPVRSQPTYRYDATQLGIGGRTTALADAYSADASDINSMYSNPASLSFLRTSTLALNHAHDWELQTFRDNMAFPVRVSAGSVIGVGIDVTSAGYLQPTPSVGGVRFAQYGLDLGYSVNVTPAFSLGTLIGVRHAVVDDQSLISSWYSIGAFYAPTPGYTYGAVFKGIGSGLTYTFAGDKTVVQREAVLPKSLEIGAALTFPTMSKDPQVCMSFATERTYPQREFRGKGGLEVFPFKFLSLRIGYVVGGNSTLARYGIGIRTGLVQLDYGVSPSASDNRFDEMSVSFRLGGR